MKARENTWKEFLSTEKNYLDILTIIVQDVIKPTLKKELLTESQRKVLFINIGEIYNFHVNFYNKMEKIIKKYQPYQIICDKILLQI